MYVLLFNKKFCKYLETTWRVFTFRTSFSTSFCLEVLHKVIDKILSLDFEKKHPIAHATLKPLLSCKQERKDLDLQPSDKLISYDQLWQDVVQNLQKAEGTRDHIYITRSEVDHLDEKLQDQSYAGNDNQTYANAVLFTCGHYYTKKLFVEEVLVKFSSELSKGAVSLPESANVLVQYYNRQGLLPMACPKCVLNAIHALKVWFLNSFLKPQSDIHCNRSATSPQPKFKTIAEESQQGFAVGRRLIGDWLHANWSATSWGPICDLMQLVADQSPTKST